MTKIEITGLAMDPTTVNAIKEHGNTVEGLIQVADQFETMFLQMVLKSMRTASDALASDDSFVNSDRQRMYRDMYDGQLTMAMADKSALGIADAMVRQMSPLVASVADAPLENNLNFGLKFNEKQVANSIQETLLGSFSQPLLNI
ncbi:rod-binding protein [Moritella yayanosii]|uniref:Putative Peptidoglycan hydrolase FlgJ n=1 Tax=Moritella yayanosii TaxID=69539 RepID=A0A330LNS0_9GAMM|nr:rod-binding protein [Moritella yayanosii]SQD78647.1 putative Peptidoglycan hydrolase FlgJ [Moritella yayanosii]